MSWLFHALYTCFYGKSYLKGMVPSQPASGGRDDTTHIRLLPQFYINTGEVRSTLWIYIYKCNILKWLCFYAGHFFLLCCIYLPLCENIVLYFKPIHGGKKGCGALNYLTHFAKPIRMNRFIRGSYRETTCFQVELEKCYPFSKIWL